MPDAPKTLRAMAGAPAWQHPGAGEAAVVLIDAQREYTIGALPLHGVTPALAEISRLRARASAMGLPVIHVRHAGAPGGLFDLDGPGGAFCDEAVPRDGEAVIDKSLPNAFAGTDLAARLEALGIRRIVVAGFMTHMCVSSTVRAALDLGFSSAVIGSACATRALPTPHNGPIAAADLHRASLAALSDRFADILRTSAEI
ncbi:cysteine hydrolase family protein [Breoghania sp. L-A4]|uniref:cysteine hydrolase family protein n=1 Tax=Breoghania sp. L-A4 TaxID=2304600 RepID=UPI000E358B0A|nr:cysteine hydrolase family protein [Breoghania sp. L-A4]AXS39114.1 cysteine hydrolase [Breoghania sp. L-A4]